MANYKSLDDLTVRLTSFKAGPSRPVDFNQLKDKNGLAKLASTALPQLYEQYGQIFPVIQKLCPLYAQADPEEQALVRAMIASSRDACHGLRQYSPSLAVGEHPTYQQWRDGYEAFKKTDSDGWLRLLITVLALALTQIDYRDDILAIQHLGREAQQLGLDFEPYRQELIRLSDRGSAAQVGLLPRTS